MDLNGRVFLPHLVRVSYARLNPTGAYMLENGQRLFLWLGREVPQQFLQDVFGVQTLDEVDSSLVSTSVSLLTVFFLLATVIEIKS